MDLQKKFKSFAGWLLAPGGTVTAALVIVSAALLTIVFLNGWEETPLAYIAYPLSAWALTAAVFQTVRIIPHTKSRFIESRLWNYVQAHPLRQSLPLLSGLFISLFYALFKFITGCVYHSPWLIAVALYYAVLATMRYILLRRRSLSGFPAQRAYRLTGALMILLALTMSGMAVQMVADHRAYTYPGFIIYASAAYTFYSLSIAVLQMIRCRSSDNLMLRASRTLTLAVALMSLFALQTGLLEQFSSPEDTAFRTIINAFTGGFVCITTLLCGIRMLAAKFDEITSRKDGCTI